MAAAFDIKDLERRMRGAVEQLKKEFSGLRTGRASAHLLDPIMVTVYGSKMPLAQVATVSTPDPRMITVQVWDRSQVQAVEKAIRESNLGLNPMTEGATIRLPIPPLTADRRNELAKVAHKYAEHGRVVVRNVRRDGMEALKKAEKDGMSEDESRKNGTKVQELTDKIIKEIDQLLVAKEAEIKQV
ncbi:MAG TPA: ribosome recycling factor [Hyphomicrobiaceae bacterium]|nr:ribosome recycling factor [Hyphomicrobiaceae bacterium]